MRTTIILVIITALSCIRALGQSAEGMVSAATMQAGTDDSVWAGNPGNGLRKGATEFEGMLGGGMGLRGGVKRVHDLALSELRVGRVVTRVLGDGHWYQGNVELLGEVFVGAQWHPMPRYLAGFAPVLRYEFATGTRWVPFVDASAGLTGTAIGHPDLGANFEFDLQGGPGLKYYFRDNASAIFQYRYLHFSDAGLYAANHGINVNVFMLGMSWAF